MRLVCRSVILVTVYKATELHNPEEHSLNLSCLIISYVINIVYDSFWESGMWSRRRQQAASASLKHTSRATKPESTWSGKWASIWSWVSRVSTMSTRMRVSSPCPNPPTPPGCQFDSLWVSSLPKHFQSWICFFSLCHCMPSACRWRRPQMWRCSCEYVKYATTDSRQGAVLQLCDWAMDEQPLAMDYFKDPSSWSQSVWIVNK